MQLKQGPLKSTGIAGIKDLLTLFVKGKIRRKKRREG